MRSTQRTILPSPWGGRPRSRPGWGPVALIPRVPTLASRVDAPKETLRPSVLVFRSKRCMMTACSLGCSLFVAAVSGLLSRPSAGQQAALPVTTEGDFLVKNFKFRSGGMLPELRLHYTTLGKPLLNAEGRVTNAVLMLHGTGGSGQQFMQPQFAGELFGPGQLLDANHYFIILPDGVGHGKSSKPSDGRHAHFPEYDYDDMVAAHYQLLNEGLGVNHCVLSWAPPWAVCIPLSGEKPIQPSWTRSCRWPASRWRSPDATASGAR